MRFKIIESLDDYFWEKAWEIYRTSFDNYNKRSLEAQKNAMNNNSFKCLVAFDGKRFIGILFFWDFDNFRYIEHLAYNKELRGQDYELLMVEEFCKIGSPVIIEIEKIVDNKSISRFSKYEELGFKRNIYEHKKTAYNKELEEISSIVLSYPNKLTFEDYLYFNNILINEIMLYR